MSGKILIFGGAGGIGAATARALANKRFALHLAGRNTERLQAAAASIQASFTVADVEDPGSISNAVAQAGAPLAGLVYAVGTINLKPLARLTASDFERDFRINALGAAQVVQSALPALKAHDGVASILLFSTVAVAQGFANHASISMAKGAVEGLTRALACELAPKIRVNAIAPSLTKTPLAQAITANEAVTAAVAGLHALQRLGEASEIGSLAAFLVSPEASWITGQVIAVDGGRSTLRTKG